MMDFMQMAMLTKLGHSLAGFVMIVTLAVKHVHEREVVLQDRHSNVRRQNRDRETPGQTAMSNAMSYAMLSRISCFCNTLAQSQEKAATLSRELSNAMTILRLLILLAPPPMSINVSRPLFMTCCPFSKSTLFRVSHFVDYFFYFLPVDHLCFGRTRIKKARHSTNSSSGSSRCMY